MKIIPKISTNDVHNMEIIEKYLRNFDSVEIQFMTDDLEEDLFSTFLIMNEFENINYFILHMPFGMCNLEYIYSNRKLFTDFKKLLVECVDVAQHCNLKIDVLTHLNYTGCELEHSDLYEFINNTERYLEDTGVTLLIENSIIDISNYDNKTGIDYLFGKFSNYDNIKFCLDLCHLQASENALNTQLSLSDSLLKHLKNIHFSATLNHDGYKDKKKTHGRVHESIDAVIRDMFYLKSKGVDIENMNFVVEISEDDYINRPDMIKEIQYLNEYSDNVHYNEHYFGNIDNGIMNVANIKDTINN